MIQIYTTPSCSSCRKAKKWFEEHRIEYREKNIFNIKLAKDDISKNGRIGIFSFDNTSAPSEMLEILTDIENKEYDK